jgi:L-alanine-DL-glutamate epimerase-like enolase superfamily enzyme
MARFRIESLAARSLSVPLVEPFVIASGRVEVTPNVLVSLEVVELDSGARARGIGEAATLPPVTREAQADVLARLQGLRPPALAFREREEVEAWTTEAIGAFPCARAGLSTALVDALARLDGAPLCDWSGGTERRVSTDMTIPIGEPARMVRLASGWSARGFRCFKVKIGRDADADLRALEGIHRAVPGATFRVDANAGFSAADAIRVGLALTRLGLAVECFEQPCAKGDLDAMAEVARAVPFDVVADESCADAADLGRIVAARAADGINLKLVKTGGFLETLALGRAARAAGMSLMVGSMVETRLGVTAAAHLACALGGVEYPDLDTAWLLEGDPFEGGYLATGPDYVLPDAPGLGVTVRST